jgi:hypothetical protein
MLPSSQGVHALVHLLRHITGIYDVARVNGFPHEAKPIADAAWAIALTQ